MSIAETLEREGQMTEQQASMHQKEPERALDGEQRENGDEQAPESPQGLAQQERPHEARVLLWPVRRPAHSQVHSLGRKLRTKTEPGADALRPIPPRSRRRSSAGGVKTPRCGIW